MSSFANSTAMLAATATLFLTNAMSESLIKEIILKRPFSDVELFLQGTVPDLNNKRMMSLIVDNRLDFIESSRNNRKGKRHVSHDYYFTKQFSNLV